MLCYLVKKLGRNRFWDYTSSIEQHTYVSEVTCIALLYKTLIRGSTFQIMKKIEILMNILFIT